MSERDHRQLPACSLECVRQYTRSHARVLRVHRCVCSRTADCSPKKSAAWFPCPASCFCFFYPAQIPVQFVPRSRLREVDLSVFARSPARDSDLEARDVCKSSKKGRQM
eukprot:1229306-Rhodomonas_salina.3